MKRAIWMLGVVTLLGLAPGIGWAGPITYSIVDYPDNQSGYHVSGQVTTDGTIGSITDSNIVSWSFTITDPSGNFVGAGSSTLPGAGTYIVADASSSEIDFGFNNFDVFRLYNTGGLEYEAEGPLFDQGQYNIFSFADYTVTVSFIWNNEVSLPNGLNASPFVYADNGTPAVAAPEPSTLTLLGIGAVCSLGYGWRRRRQSA